MIRPLPIVVASMAAGAILYGLIRDGGIEPPRAAAQPARLENPDPPNSARETPFLEPPHAKLAKAGESMIGLLGKPLGTRMTIRGELVVEDKGIRTCEWFVVREIDDRKCSPPIWLNSRRIKRWDFAAPAALPEGVEVELDVFEAGAFAGVPPGMIDDLGLDLPPRAGCNMAPQGIENFHFDSQIIYSSQKSLSDRGESQSAK